MENKFEACKENEDKYIVSSHMTTKKWYIRKCCKIMSPSGFYNDYYYAWQLMANSPAFNSKDEAIKYFNYPSDNGHEFLNNS